MSRNKLVKILCSGLIGMSMFMPLNKAEAKGKVSKSYQLLFDDSARYNIRGYPIYVNENPLADFVFVDVDKNGVLDKGVDIAIIRPKKSENNHPYRVDWSSIDTDCDDVPDYADRIDPDFSLTNERALNTLFTPEEDII